METIVIKSKKGKDKHTVDSRIRICINCGNVNIDFYEHGVSCETCGADLYFGRLNY